MLRKVTSCVLVALILAVFTADLWAGRFFFRSSSVGTCGPGVTCGPNGCSIVSPSYVVSAPLSAAPASAGSYVPENGATSPPTIPPGGVVRSDGTGTKDVLDVGPKAPKHGALINGVELPEDAARPYITIVGPKELQEQAKAIVKESGVEKVFHVVAYDEGQFQAKDAGYTRGVWITEGRDANDQGEVFSYDEDPERMRQPLKRLAECIRQFKGEIEKTKLSTIAQMFDPWTLIMERIGPFIGYGLNAATFVLLALAVFKR